MSLLRRVLRKHTTWSDLYAPGGTRTGERCESEWPKWAARCVRERGHSGKHRDTSSADGRSITWEGR